MSSAEVERLLSRQEDSSDDDEEVLFNSPAGATVPVASSPSSRPSETEGPPPTYSNQLPATLTPISLVHQSNIPTGGNPPHEVPSFSQHSGITSGGAPPPSNPAPSRFEKPPDYSLHAANGGSFGGKAGMAVHIQMDGRLVPGTIMEDASGRHMVYICQPQQQSTAPDQPAVRPPCPKDYFFLSLLSLLCCCAPLGFFALIKSLEVHRLYRRGDYNGALRASKQAHSWGSAAVVFGATIVIIVFALKLYFTESSHGTHYYYYQ